MFWAYKGSWRFRLRLGLDPVVFATEECEIEVETLEDVISLCEVLIEAITNGDLDNEIRETIRTRPQRGRFMRRPDDAPASDAPVKPAPKKATRKAVA